MTLGPAVYGKLKVTKEAANPYLVTTIREPSPEGNSEEVMCGPSSTLFTQPLFRRRMTFQPFPGPA